MDSYEKLPIATRKKLNLDLEPGSSKYKHATSIACDKFFAMAFLMSSDPRRYKNLLTKLDNDHSKGTDNYPTMLTSAYSLLVNYHAPQTFQNRSHTISDNDDESEDDVSFLNTPGAFVPICHLCRKKGHMAPKCPEKAKNANTPTSTLTSTPTTDAVQLLMNAVEESQSSGLDFSFNSNLGSQSTNYYNYLDVCLNVLSTQLFQPITTSQQIILKNGGHVDPHWILLDTQSTVNLFSNRNLLKTIKKTNGYPLRCYCNGGFQDSTLVGTLDGYGEVWYNPRSLANILSMALVSDLFRVSFDSAKEQAIFVWRTDGTFIKFIRSP